MDMKSAADKSASLQDKHYSDVNVGGAIPIAPDGGIVPGYGSVAPAPQAPESAWICKRGPCRHFWHLSSEFPAGNPESTWEGLTDPLTGAPVPKPKQHSYSCLVQLGYEMDLTEDTVFDCNRWDPIDPDDREIVERGRRRDLYKIRLARKP